MLREQGYEGRYQIRQVNEDEVCGCIYHVESTVSGGAEEHVLARIRQTKATLPCAEN